MRPVVTLPLVFLLATPAGVAHAQAGRDRLPPKQPTIARVAPPPGAESPAPIRGPGSAPAGGHGTVPPPAGAVLGSGWAYGAGLQAQLFLPHQQRLRFALNDRAYVAVFEIQPGRGVRLVYPNDYHAEQPVPPGWHQPPLPMANDPLAGAGAPAERGPRWLYLVASDAPLGLVPAKRSVAALHAQLGGITFQSASPHDVAAGLRRHVLTLGRELTWTDALVAYRPGVEDPLSVGTAPSVRCGNGVTYVLGAGERFECPR